MDPDRLAYLLNRYVDEALSPLEKAELEQTLLGSAAARSQFWEHAGMHALLREEAAQAGGPRMTAAVEQAAAGPGLTVDPGWGLAPPPAPFRKLAWLAPWLAAAAVVALGLGWGLRQTGPASAPMEKAAPESEATVSSIAVVTEMVNANWSGGGKPMALGTNLEAGWIKLDSGTAQLEFVSGARVILEGPAEFQLISPLEAYCRRGRLTVEVPPQAEGFRVHARQFFVVDLGTSFGMKVSADGAAEVHVFAGEVEVHQGGGMRALTEGRAVTVDPAGTVRETAGTSVGAGFPSPSGMDSLAGELRRRRQDTWHQVLASHAQQPGLLRYFSFDVDPSARRNLKNLSPVPEADAAIVGAQWTEGRWPGKRALDFRGVNDRVRFEVPGGFTALTMVAAVRTSGAPGRGSSLMMTDGYDAGEVHWQISPKGELQVGIQHPDLVSGVDYKSPVVFTPERGGQWLRVALVIDGSTKEVRHYVDGGLISSQTLRSPLPLRIGMAELGNWNRLGRATVRPVRNYVGMMDEFMLFDRALTEAEITSLCGWNADG